jgi:hypothetical protein
MAAAERELAARTDHALGVTREVEARLAEFEPAADEEPPAPDVERLKAFVLGYARTPEWVAVLDRIDEGTLTWPRILESLFSGRPDPGIAAAFESLSAVPPPTREKLVELGIDPVAPEPAAPHDPGRRRIITWPGT